MTRTIYEIDEEGYMTYEIKGIGVDEQIPEGFVDTPLPTDEMGRRLPFWRPKWTGAEWIEDKSQEEFDEEKLMDSLTPTQQQITYAELEIKILYTLMEVELI